MDVSYVNPFIESVQDFFNTMLTVEVTRGKIGVCHGAGGPRSIIALIGMSGSSRGTVALQLPPSTALSIVNRLLGTDNRIVDETVTDGIAEVVNIVAGGAKARFPSADDHPMELSLPTVIKGSNYQVDCPTRTLWLEVPFQSDLGSFSLRVAVEERAKNNGDNK